MALCLAGRQDFSSPEGQSPSQPWASSTDNSQKHTTVSAINATKRPSTFFLCLPGERKIIAAYGRRMMKSPPSAINAPIIGLGWMTNISPTVAIAPSIDPSMMNG